VSFVRPPTGQCFVIARFAGDEDHPPAREEDLVRC